MIGHPQAVMTKSPAFSAASPSEGAGRSPFTALWLFCLAVLVVAMVVVGGATRLTGSGLSITQWKPLLGAIPPLSDAAWIDVYHRYQATPQYHLVNRGMTLEQFKPIFWWEWSHRLLGRALGVVFALPFIALIATRRLPRRLVPACSLLFALGGLQGAVGWWMVKSGLEGRVLVAPERLATHLGLALILLCALIWTGLEAWAGEATEPQRRRDGWRVAAGLFAAGVYLQCLLGALVAGNQAGLLNADWPLMSGRLFPADYGQGGLWSTFAHGAAAVQFNHRLLAYALTVFALGLVWAATRSEKVARALRNLCITIGMVACVQAVLGVSTLLTVVALPIAVLHQLTATVLLSFAVALAWRARRI